MPNSETAEQAVEVLKFGDRVFVQGVAAAPSELIAIAHPDHREHLERQAFDRFGPSSI